jgi:hypothetical protein
MLLRSSILCRCINFPGKQVDAVPGMGSMPYRMYDICKKEEWSVLGARRQNLSRLRVEKLGCAYSPAGLVALGLFVRPSNQSGCQGRRRERTAGGY